MSIFVFIEEEIFLRRIVGPDVFNGVIRLLVVFDVLEVLHHFEGRTRSHGEVNQLILCGRPRSVFEVGGKFKCPIHGVSHLGAAKVTEPQFCASLTRIQRKMFASRARFLVSGPLFFDCTLGVCSPPPQGKKGVAQPVEVAHGVC